jgi:hypothetical protein
MAEGSSGTWHSLTRSGERWQGKAKKELRISETIAAYTRSAAWLKLINERIKTYRSQASRD